MTPPRNVSALKRALRQIASSNEDAAHLQLIMANVVAGQFLKGAVMRGGASLKLRYGDATTRYTMDFDASRNVSEDDFVERYGKRLAEGWNGFAGRIVRERKPRPHRVPTEYVMQPFEIKLTYNNRPWCTVDFELSYNEVGDADAYDIVPLPIEVVSIFRKLDLPDPEPFPLMKIVHQVAQKLHGVTDPDYVRAQDLIDLQLMFAHENIDLVEVNAICSRLFPNRQKHAWPAQLAAEGEEWRLAYDNLKGSLPVIPTLREAATWLNRQITMIAAAGSGIRG